MSQFDIFAAQSPLTDSKIVLLPVPWELTTSYGRGTYNGPMAIHQASPQIDLYDYELGDVSAAGIHMLDVDKDILKLHEQFNNKALTIIADYDEGHFQPKKIDPRVKEVNAACHKMVERIYKISEQHLKQEKLIGLIGGEHSVPLGLIQALGELHSGEFGVLHIDAHADLRAAYQGFAHSHASIMNNVLSLTQGPKKLVQVAIRDFCQEELEIINSDSRIHCFYDRELKKKLFSGTTWDRLCHEIVDPLPEKVYISFDIDGLSPVYCPHTGTPVAGGLSFDQALHLLNVLGTSGKTIIGFDLCEVAPSSNNSDEWDGNVGARLLYKLCGWMERTNDRS